ncbi:MAG: PTS lactose/cellobiose transporter subunit IIA [Erysipelotrichaceae bacterium]
MENFNENIPFQLICNGGDASSLFLRAINEAKSGRIEEAKKLVEQGEVSLLSAHKIQTQLIVQEANGESVQMNVLMVHAQDHLMNAILLKELVGFFIQLYQRTAGLEDVK